MSANDKSTNPLVLIIDDSKAIRQFVEELLTAENYRVSSAPDGFIGMELMQLLEPDVVLLDIEMPVMNGMEVLEAMKLYHRLFSIVMLTSRSTIEDRLAGFESGADDYITKPFNKEDLISRVMAAARTTRIKKALAESRDHSLDLLNKYEAATKQLIEQQKLSAMAKMISGMAHQMNNPLGFVRSNLCAILKYTDLLNEGFERIAGLQEIAGGTDNPVEGALKDTILWLEETKIRNFGPGFKSLIEETADGINRISATIKRLLQIDLADRPVKKMPTNMKQVIETILLEKRVQHPEKVFVIETGTESLIASCNESQIVAAFENIIDNAIDSIRGKGWISVGLVSENDHIIVDITDTGDGIPQGDLEKIFEPFFSTKTSSKNVGLGLTVTKYFIKGHDGSIEIKSARHKGTKVIIKLPMSNPALILHA